MMRPFEYASPRTREQALGLLGASWGATEILAGGTDLLALMKDDVLHPRRLVNIKEIAEMRGVHASADSVRIGALTTMGELADDPEIRRSFPALADALQEAASPQIRNLATLGGNLCQRPRCWYFRRGYGLLARDANGKDLVAGGENRYHAIFANDGPARFVSPSTVAPALIAYGARVRLASRKGARELDLEKFYVVPASEGQREHDLRPDEMVTEIVLPRRPDLLSAHYEVRQKEVFDWPLAVAAVTLQMNGNTVQSARIVMGQVAPIPWVAGAAADALRGKPLEDDAIRGAGEAAVHGARPLSQNAYKVKLARVAVQRALAKAKAGGAA